MVWDRTNRPFWCRCVAALFLAALAALIRWQFLGVLGLRAAFLTFYPAVALAALYGGFSAGLLASVASAALADYFWSEPVGHLILKNIPDAIGVLVFLAASVLISYLAEAAFRGQARAERAEEHSRLLVERERAAENAARLAAILESSNDAIIAKTLEGKILSWNRAAQAIFGYCAEEAVGRSISILYSSDRDDELLSILERIGRAEAIENLETVRRKKSGESVDVSLSIYPMRDASGKIAGASTIARDITERKRMERERDVTIELLKIINDNAGTAELVRAAAYFFQDQSGCEAVGIRLKEGDDFPYALALGFPEEFVRTENSICAWDALGNVVRDSSGNPHIECMCGNVILERVDPSKPFFSPGGSFWTNSTTRLLDTSSDGQWEARTRNRCKGAGYESVALIPLNVGPERFGLLQLNDRQKDRFSPELIAQWERLAGYLAVALARSRTEETMRESEERFRVMVNSIPQLAWLSRPDGYTYWHNSRWYEYTGTSPEQMEGWGWRGVHDPDALPDVLARWEESITTGKAFDMVFPLRGADGNFRQFLTRVAPVKDAHGNVVRWCGTATDITEHRQMEEELRRSELQFRLLSQTASNLLASDNPQGLVDELCRNIMAHLDCHCFFNFLVDESAGKLHLNACAGIPEEEAEKIEWLDYGVAICGCVASARERIVAEDIFHTADMRTELVKSYGIQAYACHPLMAQGKLIGTLSFGTKTRKGFSADELALMKTVADQVAVAMERISLIEGLGKSRDELESRVSERTAELERANEVVKAERKRLFDVLETLPAMIRLLTSDYHVAFANRSFRAKFGESYGRHCYEYCFQKSQPCDFCETYRVLETGQPHHWEFKDSDGSVIDAYSFPFTDVDGSRMVLEMDIDITDRRRAEAELRSTMEKLEQSNQALQDFASIASHDLQEPLRKVVSFGSILKQKYADSLGESGNDYLGRMLDATQRMQSLLKGLLEYSRVTTQANPFTKVDLNKIVGEVLSDLEVRIERAGAEVRVSKLPVVKADPTQMRQVLQNLIGNALKFHKDEKQPVVEVRGAVGNGKLEIIVEDNGIGFDDQYVDKIFSPFQRLHGRSSPYAGTGMGLAICKKIVERHGGSMRAEGVPGKGSKFIISLSRTQGE